MNWLYTLVLVFHMLFAAGIVGLVLLQRGKGAEAGAGFGAGASGTVFGARGSASFLSRSTAVLATLFFITSLSLAYFAGSATTQSSVMDTMPAAKTEVPKIEVPASAPVAPSASVPIKEEVPMPATTPTTVPVPVETPAK